ncbi:PIN domain-like protein [Helicostylum pulchrum]|nr:PIN domain-like protein [Helicostylum pulchrum]
MGIQGLIPLLKSIQKPVEISEYAGQLVAVDGHCWLHRGAFSCASELARGVETNAFVEYFMNLVKMLVFYKVVPIIVFDGQQLPIKQVTTDSRATLRSVKLKEGKALFKDGKINEANKCFQQAITITPSMVAKVIKELDRHKIQHIVSPYEADPQLAFMLKSGQAKAVITEDSDLLAFGCSNVIFKMDRSGEGVQMSYKDVFDQVAGITNATTFRYMCILSGCDYLPSLPGIGLIKASDIVKSRKNIKDILQVVQHRFPKEIASEYGEKFAKADAAFLYQFVFDPNSRTYVRLNPLPEDIKVDYLSGLGESPQNRNVSILKSNNAIYLDHVRILREANKENIDPFVQLAPSEFNEFEFDDKALQDMELLLKKVEPVVKSSLPPPPPPRPRMFGPRSISSHLKSITNVNSSRLPSSPPPPSSSPPPLKFGPRYIPSRPKSITNVNSFVPSVNKITTEPARFIDMLSPKGGKFTVWKDEESPKKPVKSIFRPRSPPPPFKPSSFKPVLNKENAVHAVNIITTKPEKPTKSFFRARSPPPPSSFKPVLNKENAVHTPPVIKYQSSQKRKSPLDDYPDPFAKIKKPFSLADTSVVRRGLCKK